MIPLNRLVSYLIFSLVVNTFAFAQQPQTGNATTALQQQASKIHGAFDLFGNFFQRDTNIGAFNIPQYDRQLVGADAWLSLNYSHDNLDMGIRFDLFNNSNLLVPTQSYTAQGIGRWYIRKQIDKLQVQAGYIYDRIGSGIIFRSYEERALAIDNALLGVSAKYDITPNWYVKAFTGKQKQQFSIYNPVIRGFNSQGFWAPKSGKFTMAPGVGVVHRTLDDETMNQVVAQLNTYTPKDSIGAQYNTFAFSAYNTLNVGNFTWYVEGAYKTAEVMNDPGAERLNWNGQTSLGKFVNKPGTVLYTTLSYGGKGLGVSAEYKRTDHFTFRVNPFVTLNRGMLNYLPPMTRNNTYRLPARYAAATQEIGEQAYQFDVTYSPVRKLTFYANTSHITTLSGRLLYNEIYGYVSMKRKHWQATLGLQHLDYNIEVYFFKPGEGMLEAWTPFTELLYKFKKGRALRLEAQYMNTHKDFGSWVFAQVEYSMAPHWIFTVSDMYNIKPKKTEDLHYPTFGMAYTRNSTRLSVNYVKQVEGVVCSGGICRLEPAFSGVKMTVSTTF